MRRGNLLIPRIMRLPRNPAKIPGIPRNDAQLFLRHCEGELQLLRLCEAHQRIQKWKERYACVRHCEAHNKNLENEKESHAPWQSHRLLLLRGARTEFRNKKNAMRRGNLIKP